MVYSIVSYTNTFLLLMLWIDTNYFTFNEEEMQQMVDTVLLKCDIKITAQSGDPLKDESEAQCVTTLF